MARGTKNVKAALELTPEEKLQNALVPAEEQPYEIPENWVWTRIGNLYEINPKTQAEDDVQAAFVPMEKVSPGFDDKFQYDTRQWGKIKKGYTHFKDGDVVVAKISPCFENGKSAVIENLPNGIGAGTTELIVLRQRLVNPKYTFFIVISDKFIIQGKKTFSGTVGQQRVNLDYVKQYHIPLPPLAEQTRIVSIIVTLFSQLDEARAKAQAVVDGFEDRKAAILHRAFTGELTAKWREENGVGLESWEEKTIREFATVRGGKRLPKGASLITEKTAHPYLRIADFGDIEIDMSDIHYISDDIFHAISRYIINYNDVYLSIVGTIGKCGTIPIELDGANLTENAARIITNTTIPQYLARYLSSPAAQQDIRKRIRSATLGKLSLLNINKILVPIPPKEEQKEIVNILDELLNFEAKVKETSEQVIGQIDVIKKSILARAFRGELGTNDPTDESAVELLKRVLE